jgi:hypothetical protein
VSRPSCRAETDQFASRIVSETLTTECALGSPSEAAVEGLTSNGSPVFT